MKAGVPIVRFNVSQPVLHPTIGSHLNLWTRDRDRIKTESGLRASQEAGSDFTPTNGSFLLRPTSDSRSHRKEHSECGPDDQENPGALGLNSSRVIPDTRS